MPALPNATNRAAEQAAYLDRKRELQNLVRTRFARFGPQVLRVVMEFALHPRRMPIMLNQCNLRLSCDLNAQLDDVRRYVISRGQREFLSHFAQLKSRQVESSNSAKTEPFENPVAHFEETRSDPKKFGERWREAAVQAAWSDHEPIASLPEDTEVGAARPIGSRPINGLINSSSYQADDRRNDGKRRLKTSRRSSIEAIGENRRFGGERRRRPLGRRTTDYS